MGIHSTGLVLQNMFFRNTTRRSDSLRGATDARGSRALTELVCRGRGARGATGAFGSVLWKYFVSNAHVMLECVVLERPRIFDWSAVQAIDEDIYYLSPWSHRLDVRSLSQAHAGEAYRACWAAFLSTIKFTTYCYSFGIMFVLCLHYRCF